MRQLLLTLLRAGHTLVASRANQDFCEPATRDFLAHFEIKAISEIELIHALRRQAT